MKFRIFLVCVFFILNLTGCAMVKEGFRGFMGTSTKSLEKNRKSAIAKSVNYDYFTCYTNVLDILKRTGSYVYAQDIRKHMIAVYVSEQDTTPVGLFFSATDKNNTLLEVSSPSTYGKEVIAEKVFLGLEKSLHPERFIPPPLPGNATSINATQEPER
jgi:hypothetical protein